MNQNEFAVDLPYPSIDGIKKNKNDLLILINDYSGYISELSAITQYVYHKLNFENQNLNEVGKILLNIAIIEMRHLNIFGNMITKLGGNPKFVYKNDRNFDFWSADMIDCKTEIIEMLKSDILLEEETIKAYEKHAKEVSQNEIKTMLERIVLDEKLHVKILTKELEKLENK